MFSKFGCNFQDAKAEGDRKPQINPTRKYYRRLVSEDDNYWKDGFPCIIIEVT